IRASRKAHHILEKLYDAYCHTAEMLPPEVQQQAETDDIERALVDYLSGMTERYANNEYRDLFHPGVLTRGRGPPPAGPGADGARGRRRVSPAPTRSGPSRGAEPGRWLDAAAHSVRRAPPTSVPSLASLIQATG